jgi:hypothetical protein
MSDDSASNISTALKAASRICASTNTTAILLIAFSIVAGPSEETVLTCDVQKREEKEKLTS